MNARRWHSASATLICLMVVLPASGQSTRPAADQAFEGQALRISDSEARAATIRSAGSSAVTSSASDLSRIAIALVVVVGLILLLRAGFRHMTAAGGGRGGKLVSVLSRSMVSPKQQVLVLQVGRRLLVVGDSGGHMTSLCEISDPDEIALMVGQTRSAPASGRSPGSFGSLFRRANEPFGEAQALQSTNEESAGGINPEDAVSAEEVGGLLDKVRQLQKQFNESKPALGPHNPA